MNDMSYERYAKIRDAKGYTDYRVAKLSGVSQSTLSEWRAGRYKPKMEKLQKIAEALGVPLIEMQTDIKLDVVVHGATGDSVVTVEMESLDEARFYERMIEACQRLNKGEAETALKMILGLANTHNAGVELQGEHAEEMYDKIRKAGDPDEEP